MSFAAMRNLLTYGLMLMIPSAFSALGVQGTLPGVAYADLETTTNIALCAESGAGRLSISLSCLATPSNNVQAAFGEDVNGDGVLGLEETALTVGWDCGVWFVRQGSVGRPVEEPAEADGTVRELALSVRFGASGEARRLSAESDGAPVFADLTANPQPGLHGPGWNLMRLTGRGLHGHDEAFAVRQTTDAVAIRFR